MRALTLAAAISACTAPNETSLNSYAGIEVAADLAPSEGLETVRATVTDVSVVSATGEVLAALPAFEPQGSADEVEAVSVIDPRLGLISVTTTVGGHRESWTYTTVYHFAGRKLDKLYMLEQLQEPAQ